MVRLIPHIAFSGLELRIQSWNPRHGQWEFANRPQPNAVYTMLGNNSDQDFFINGHLAATGRQYDRLGSDRRRFLNLVSEIHRNGVASLRGFVQPGDAQDAAALIPPATAMMTKRGFMARTGRMLLDWLPGSVTPAERLLKANETPLKDLAKNILDDRLTLTTHRNPDFIAAQSEANICELQGASAPPSISNREYPNNRRPTPMYVLYRGLISGDLPRSTEMIECIMVGSGIPAENIHLGQSPFPGLWQNMRDRETRVSRWTEALLTTASNAGTNLYTYQRISNPDSQIAKDAFKKLLADPPIKRMLEDTRHEYELNFIGHSAGGVEAATMACLFQACKDKGQYSHVTIGKVVTLGTPWQRNNTPPDIPLISYAATNDSIHNGTSYLPGISYFSKQPGSPTIRRVITDPSVDHYILKTDSDVLNMMVRDLARP